MKPLSKTAFAVFSKLVKIATENDVYAKVNNNESFMPVSVEVIDENEFFKHVSIAHYYEQMGDLMADPEMCFAICNNSPEYVYPYYFKQDNLAIERASMFFNDNGSIKGFNGQQYDDATFANMWLRNIKNQQRL